MFISSNRTSLITRISLVILIVAQVAAMLFWSPATTQSGSGAAASASAAKGGSGNASASQPGKGGSGGAVTQPGKGNGGGGPSGGANKGGDKGGNTGDDRKGGTNDSPAGAGKGATSKGGSAPQSGSIFLVRNPAPPQCSINDGTQAENYQFTINFDSTPVSYTNYILDPNGLVVFTTSLALNGIPSPYSSPQMSWTIPLNSPIGRYEIVVDYYSLEGGTQYEAEGRVTFYVCNTAAIAQTVDAYIYNDLNMNDQDGLHPPDAGEPVLPGWLAQFTTPFGDTYGVLTDSSGHAVFSPLTGTIPAGVYTITEVIQTGWTATTNLPTTVDVPPGGSGTRWLGNVQVPTETPTPAPTNTPTDTPTSTPTVPATNTPPPAATDTPTPAPTNTLLPVPTDTPPPAPTNTPGGPTDTPAPHMTPTTPPAQPTDTPAPPAPSNTPVPPGTTPVPPSPTAVPPGTTPVPTTAAPPTDTPAAPPPAATNTPEPPAAGQVTPTPFEETGGLGNPRLPRTGSASTPLNDDTLPLYILLAFGLIALGSTVRKLTARRANN